MIHTMTISYRIISSKVYADIYSNLKMISERFNYPLVKNERGYKTFALSRFGITEIELFKVNVDKKYKGSYMQIDMRINPAKILGKEDTALTSAEDFKKASLVFEDLKAYIHSELPKLELWTTKRIDYAFNIYTSNVEEYIKLFKRGDRLKGLIEPKSGTSANRGQFEGSLYLYNKSVAINLYNKELERRIKGFEIESAKGLLRLEVQCNKEKLYSLRKKYKLNSNLVREFISDELSWNVVYYYYNKIIGKGDYYTLEKAKELIEECLCSNVTKKNMKKIIEEVNKYRSIYKAREKSSLGKQRFKKYIEVIRKINVNPVTIPRVWQLSNIKNILN